ncbi:YaaA family protein [Candidatus Saccharibacteria bacterium]|nr:YaaA family protein [Candidatus Saccharibacteria bacterium]
MIILLRSSKTMPSSSRKSLKVMSQPKLLQKAIVLDMYLKTLSVSQIVQSMRVSSLLAEKTRTLIAEWSVLKGKQNPAVDSFLGDIFSGLQVESWSVRDREYANNTLKILSGLYGILRPLDGIYPYRLEMGYKLPNKKFANLYTYWGESIAATLPKTGLIINLSAIEYTKTITPLIDNSRMITPSFLTISPKTSEPTFVTVHTKIARGAFAHWLITNRITEPKDFATFTALGYQYSNVLSKENMPVFVCKNFEGKGLSVRLSN